MRCRSPVWGTDVACPIIERCMVQAFGARRIVLVRHQMYLGSVQAMDETLTISRCDDSLVATLMRVENSRGKRSPVELLVLRASPLAAIASSVSLSQSARAWRWGYGIYRATCLGWCRGPVPRRHGRRRLADEEWPLLRRRTQRASGACLDRGQGYKRRYCPVSTSRGRDACPSAGVRLAHRIRTGSASMPRYTVSQCTTLHPNAKALGSFEAFIS